MIDYGRVGIFGQMGNSRYLALVHFADLLTAASWLLVLSVPDPLIRY